jgi:hypothetical protein
MNASFDDPVARCPGGPPAPEEDLKMIVLLYLEDDDEAVTRLLAAHGIAAFSRVELEGHGGGGRAGWYGRIAPHRSRMIFALVPNVRAAALLDAVRGAEGLQHCAHPVHGVQVGVEAAATSAPGQETDIQGGKP